MEKKSQIPRPLKKSSGDAASETKKPGHKMVSKGAELELKSLIENVEELEQTLKNQSEKGKILRDMDESIEELKLRLEQTKKKPRKVEGQGLMLVGCVGILAATVFYAFHKETVQQTFAALANSFQ